MKFLVYNDVKILIMIFISIWVLQYVTYLNAIYEIRLIVCLPFTFINKTARMIVRTIENIVNANLRRWYE